MTAKVDERRTANLIILKMILLAVSIVVFHSSYHMHFDMLSRVRLFSIEISPSHGIVLYCISLYFVCKPAINVVVN